MTEEKTTQNELRNLVTVGNFKLTYFHIFITILLLGIFARAWEYNALPPGLNPDEASTGVDAYSLYHFGVDRNGIGYPVHFIAWGSGQNALYAYMILPFIAIGGLTPVMVRLPMLLAGILTLILVYFVGVQTAGKKFALISMFLLAISPWHIILSRWGLESNLLPFVFLMSYACLLKSKAENQSFIASCLLFGLCFYAYGTAYAAIPVFLACAIPILLRAKRISRRNLIVGFLVLALMAAPIGLFLLVNTFQLQPIHLGFITIPRLPSQPRYESMTAIFNKDFLLTITENLSFLFNLLVTQTDGLIWNSLEPYGYFYGFTFLLAVIGILRLFRKSAKFSEQLLILCWIAAALVVGMMQPVNINRINLIFIPLILCVASFLTWLGERQKIVFVLVICAFMMGFALFTRDYHGAAYRQKADEAFFTGLLPALDFVHQTRSDNSPICMTESVNMPYIFALFSEKINPADYLSSVKYIDAKAPFREVQSFGLYTFGLENCPQENPKTIYILFTEAQPAREDVRYKMTSFDRYRVYIP